MPHLLLFVLSENTISLTSLFFGDFPILLVLLSIDLHLANVFLRGMQGRTQCLYDKLVDFADCHDSFECCRMRSHQFIQFLLARREEVAYSGRVHQPPFILPVPHAISHESAEGGFYAADQELGVGVVGVAAGALASGVGLAGTVGVAAALRAFLKNLEDLVGHLVNEALLPAAAPAALIAAIHHAEGNGIRHVGRRAERISQVVIGTRIGRVVEAVHRDIAVGCG